MPDPAEEWVLLAYRLPRVPSTPRSTIWRKLRRLGVAQLNDGLVALPADARTREALEWIAQEVIDNDGEATIWLGRLTDGRTDTAIRERISAAVAEEYTAVTEQADHARQADEATRRRTAARLRRELHRIAGRDFFASPQRDLARRAVDELVNQAQAPTVEVRQ